MDAVVKPNSSKKFEQLRLDITITNVTNSSVALHIDIQDAPKPPSAWNTTERK